MSEDQRAMVLDTIYFLAKCHGRYGRMWSHILNADKYAVDSWLEKFGECKDAVDVILVLEN